MWRHLTLSKKYYSTSNIFLEARKEKKSQGAISGEYGEFYRK